MAMPSSTANWHWKTKNVGDWGQKWFKSELTTISVSGDNGEVVRVSSVEEVDGDIELGQRKSKLITIYDCKIVLKWAGTASDGTEVDGNLTIPEVSHENTVDATSHLVYNWSCSTKSSPAVDALFQTAKGKLPALLEEKFAEFPAAMINTHGKDLTVSAQPSRTGTPAPSGTNSVPVASTSTTTAKAPTPAPAAKKVEKPLNTTSISIDASFMATAEDLFSMLTDESRIPLWSRAPAQSKPEPGQSYSLFGGGVVGTYVSLEPGKKIVQDWTLKSSSWPNGHSATMTITLDQSSESTKVTFSLDGVPSGMEDELKQNIERYYVFGFKSIGYVRLFPSPEITTTTTTSHSRSAIRSRNAQSTNGKAKAVDDVAGGYTRAVAVILGVLALAAAFAVPLLARTSSRA